MPIRILVSNLGYARDIDGKMVTHFLRGHRHFRTSRYTQKKSLDAYRHIRKETDPDICCLIEVDSGSFGSNRFDQFAYLTDHVYVHHDVVSKYAATSSLNRFALTQGKCNGFMAKQAYAFERLYFSLGSKRLVYRIALADDVILFFTHLSLKRKVRTVQLKELHALADKETGAVLIAGDFNILAGIRELDLFLQDKHYTLLNDASRATFSLMGRHFMLDICLANRKAAGRSTLQVIDQPFSDHDALLIDIE